MLLLLCGLSHSPRGPWDMGKAGQVGPTFYQPLLLFWRLTLGTTALCARQRASSAIGVALKGAMEMTSIAGSAAAAAEAEARGREGEVLDMTLSEALQKWVSKHPDKVCVYETFTLLYNAAIFEKLFRRVGAAFVCGTQVAYRCSYCVFHGSELHSARNAYWISG